MRFRGGYVLVEIVVVLIVLGILAAIVVPQFTNASENPKEQQTREQLRTLRAAIELYKAQHRDALPDLNANWNALTNPSDADGGTTGTPLFGPYIPKPPVNALTGGSGISAVVERARDWYWDPNAGTIAALDDGGQVLVEQP